MKDKHAEVALLLAEVRQSQEAQRHLQLYFDAYLDKRPLHASMRSVEQAIVVSDLLVNYYTCTETILFRISQFFENSLSKEKWHQHLLEKMVLEIPGYRPRVLSDESYRSLRELLKFRHFKRYYFSIDYSWDKLDYLIIEYRKLSQCSLKKDFDGFEIFLKSLLE